MQTARTLFSVLLASQILWSFAEAGIAAPAVKGKAAPAQRSAAPGVPTAVINGYLSRLRAKALAHWNFPDGKNHAVITVIVQSDGQVSDLKASSSPQNTAAEQAGQDAFNQAQPLEALPSGVTSAKLTLMFDSNADPHGDTSSNLSTRFDIIPAPKADAGAQGSPANSGAAQ